MRRRAARPDAAGSGGMVSWPSVDVVWSLAQAMRSSIRSFIVLKDVERPVRLGGVWRIGAAAGFQRQHYWWEAAVVPAAADVLPWHRPEPEAPRSTGPVDGDPEPRRC